MYKTKIFTAEGNRHAKDVVYDTKSPTACGCFVDNSKLITDENYVWCTQRNRVQHRDSRKFNRIDDVPNEIGI